MLQKPNPTSESGRPAAERQFVDREEPIAVFQAALKTPQSTKPIVLVFHGGAGTGKSRLRRELVRSVDRRPETEDRRPEPVDRAVITATLDFDVPVHRQPDAALLFLRNAVHEAHKVRFPSFDLAYAVLWQKTHPETPLRGKSGTVPRSACVELGAGQSPFSGDSGHVPDEVQPLLEPGSLLSQLLDESGKLPLTGLIPKVSALVGSRQHVVDRVDPTSNLPPSTYYLSWWEKRGEREMEDLPQMEPAEIVEQLPKLWASDLKEFIANRSSLIASRKAVLFIDSYEKLRGAADEGRGTEDPGHKTDAWVRMLVKQLPEVLWVISGRQKLRWEEVEKEWGDVLSQHELGALPEHSAREFLSSCGIIDEPIQDAITKGSQGLPHYLNLAVDTFLEIKQSGQRAGSVQSLFSGAESSDSPEQLFAQFVRHLDQPEIATLQVLSASRFWNYGLFEHLVTEYQTGYPPTAYDDLSRFSFVGEGAAPETRTMHDLMREALQEHQAPELRKRVHLFMREFYAKQLAGLDFKNITERHRAALTEAFYHGRQAMSVEELLSLFETVAGIFHRAGDRQLVTPLRRELVQMAEAELGPNHPRLAAPVFDLAACIFLQGGYDEAEPLLRRALAIAEREPELNVNFVFYVLSHLATLLRDRDRLDEAEVASRRMVELLDKPGCDPNLRPNALSKLAVVLIHRRKYVEAEEFLYRALRIYEEAPEPETGCHADHLNTLGYLFRMQARHAEAEPFFRRALAMTEKVLGANHREVVWPLGNLASTLGHLSRYAEAEPLSRRALKLSEETLGPDHPATAATLYKSGVLLLDQGRYAEAEPLLRLALAVHAKKMGPDHPYSIEMALSLTKVLTERGDYADAEPTVLSAIAAVEQKLGPDHPDTAYALQTAGVLYSDQGRYAEAEGYLRRALDIRTGVLGQEHRNTLESLDALALLEERQGRYTEAESLSRDVLTKRERILNPDHAAVAETVNRLAGLCSRDGRYAEAEGLYRRALAIREKAFGPDHPFTAVPLEGLTKVCEQTGRAAEAQELSARAQSIRDKNALPATEKSVDSRQ